MTMRKLMPIAGLASMFGVIYFVIQIVKGINTIHTLEAAVDECQTDTIWCSSVFYVDVTSRINMIHSFQAFMILMAIVLMMVAIACFAASTKNGWGTLVLEPKPTR